MKSFLVYLKFVVFIILTIPQNIKVNYLKKQGKSEEAEKIIKDTLIKWARYTVKQSGITLNTYGQENLPAENCLFVANHQGLLDFPVLICSINRSVGFIAKKELLKIKIISFWMKQLNCIFMDRSNIRESIKSINEGVENLKNGYNMGIFPEGTRSRSEKIGEFKKGSMKLALKSNSIIVPIAINGTYKVLEANSGRIKPAEVNVIICKPINTKELTKEQQQDLSNIIRNTIVESIEKSKISL